MTLETNQKLDRILSKLRIIKPDYILMSIGIIIFVGGLIYTASFLWPRTVTYSYANEATCYSSPVIFPSLASATKKTPYKISYKPSVTIKNFPIVSSTNCVTLAAAPAENKTEITALKPFGNQFFGHTLHIKSGTMPKLSALKPESDLVSTQEKLSLKLDQKDTVFGYRVVGNNIAQPCRTTDHELSCDLSQLKLTQSNTYKLAFERTFNDQNLGTVLETSIKTVDPVHITSQSISPGSTVYDAPSQIEITADKNIADYGGVKLSATNGSQTESVDFTAQTQSQKLIIKPAKALPREATFSLKIDALSSTDKGFLPSPYELNFKTSGGPHVTGANIGNYGIGTDKNFVLSFDYDLAKEQDFNQLIAIETANGNIPATIIYGSKSITLKPAKSLPKCTAFTLRVAAGIKNFHGISSSSPWTFSSRTLCQEVFSIGTSLQGRSILAYRFGSGPSKVIYVGATHGDEQGSKYLLDSWINELEANYPKIPSHRTIIVVPLINPDGFAAKTRTNSRNVDLNRNFPANSWKSDVIMPGGNLVIGGGGTSALSEPESKAIADYILGQNPRLVLTYHSKGSLVVANESGDSVALANMYGKSSGYLATSESKLGTTFNYDTTGAMENWLYDKPGIPTLLIELKTHDTNEFSRNKSALWSMATL